jgi:ribonucleoside-diphosphate reductase alpha chain
MDDYQRFIAVSRYARWLPDEQRRETWAETVLRYAENILTPTLGFSSACVNEDLHTAIHNMDIMPSMRAMMTAGPAAERDNTCIYNCSYLPVDDPRSFDEAMFILLCGTGVGFSVERQYVSKLPEVPVLRDTKGFIKVEDSKEGWASSYLGS